MTLLLMVPLPSVKVDGCGSARRSSARSAATNLGLKWSIA